MEAIWLVDFYAPAAMVQGGKIARRISQAIKQGSRHHILAAIGRDNLDQTHLGRCRLAFVIPAIPGFRHKYLHKFCNHLIFIKLPLFVK